MRVGGQPLTQTAALLSRAEVFIGNDSGLAHLAVALGTPTVVIFGPTDDRKWGITAARHAVVKTTTPCSPCFLFGFHKLCRTHECITGIGVEEVWAAFERVVAESTRSRAR
jgi:ADP-heptose:LPS heptosyltransferase